MAIAYDTSVDGGDNAGTTSSLTFNHVCTGSNLIGFVCILGDNIGSSDDIASVTWGGVSCVFVRKYITPNEHLNRYAYIYAIIGPVIGSQSIVITSSSTHFLLAISVSYTGVDQTSNPIDQTSNHGPQSPANLTTALVTTIDNSWILLLAEGLPTNPPTTGDANTTIRKENTTYHNFLVADSNGVIHPAGSYSMTTTYPGGNLTGVIHMMVSFKPDVGDTLMGQALT